MAIDTTAVRTGAQGGGEAAAIRRALARGGGAAVTRVRYGLYRVASSSRGGRFHTVTVDGRGRYLCDCEAAVAGKRCWAMAAVFIAKTEAGGGRVVAPAAPPPAPAPARRPRREVAML